MGTIYYPDGRKEERAPRNGHDYQLDEIHEIIGGYMEIVKCKDRRYILPDWLTQPGIRVLALP